MGQWVSNVLLVVWFSELRNAFLEDSAMVIKLLYIISMKLFGSMVYEDRAADKGILGAVHD